MNGENPREENMDIKKLLGGLPETVQYLAVIGLVLVILYVCLTLTRLLGSKFGNKITYDNPQEYEKTVPDLFASTAFKRKPKTENKDKTENKEEKKDQ